MGFFWIIKNSSKTPEDLNRIFYTICGSTAVETAIKISIAYFRAKGDSTGFRFVGRERGYHGMNIGALTVGGMDSLAPFTNVVPGVQHMRHTFYLTINLLKANQKQGQN